METKISDFQSENKTIRKMTLFVEFSSDTDVNEKFIRFYGNILELIRIKVQQINEDFGCFHVVEVKRVREQRVRVSCFFL